MHPPTDTCNNHRTRTPRAPASAVIVDAAVSCAMQIPHSATSCRHTTSRPSQRQYTHKHEAAQTHMGMLTAEKDHWSHPKGKAPR
ncbi:hypothetical protein COCC4DRAFT_153580 [Bipolaris maydis ATCC 48331]|uniref:Uncharacterized protein n=2 Tax=Cochliobolus heterostrophus TaxID=5016 RepID=M2U5A0_COCH5|nr:uncharacterized protein COCC4DRAFT_153580 [Bipolaris maydis ATCC 48331]EMD93724.1 hypothetical protein COCHEDRAFT_1171784 [Bipolaris maydis C5]ENH99298.1 hypothetical protein COCC4DRAFT_153580 [Bipolaris maydis ATCC 48331]